MEQSNKVPGRILAIRLSAMGDVAMTVPVLKALHLQYPQVKVTLLTKPFFRPLFSQLPNTTVFLADIKGKHKGLVGLYHLYKELRALNPEAVVDLHNVLRSNVLKQFFRGSGIPFYQIDKGRTDKKALTASNNKRFMPLKTTHERYVDVFGQAHLPLSLAGMAGAILEREHLSGKLLDLTGEKSGKWIGIAPFAAFEGKMYPLSLMEEAIEEISSYKDYKIWLFGGGPKEKNLLDQIAQRHPNCTNITGKLSFAEELTLISNLDVMLSMDSGNGHLATNYGIPVITVWGVTHPYAGFYPFGQRPENALLADRSQYPLIPTSIYGNKMPPGYEKAIATTAPKDIAEKVIGILERDAALP